MTKNTKTLLMVGGVAIVGYLLYKKYGKGMMSSSSTTTTTTKSGATSSFSGDDRFFNANGRGRVYSRLSQCTGDGCMQLCSEGCEGGYCMVAQYDESGHISGYLKARCGGSAGSGVLVGMNKGRK
jgi:hypothetical protein